MKFIPHEYQQYAIDFIEKNAITAVLLDMGLGKTVITLTALQALLFDSFEVSKILVIAPLRVARDTWKDEIEKWEHLKDLKYSIAVGAEAERKAALKAKADIYIINRENVQWLVEESGAQLDFDMLVVDELSSFKNYQAKRFRALMKIRPKAKRVVGLTGTPTTNGLMDLWAEYRLLDLGERLGRFIGKYREIYFQPDKRSGQVIFSYKPRPLAEQEIYKKIEDITISMRSIDYLTMPELITGDVNVNLDKRDKEKYEEFKKELILCLPDETITAANAAVLVGKLAQMANGAIYGDGSEILEIHDKKLEALEEIIESANGKPLIIAYWFRHDLQRIKKLLSKMKVEHETLDSTESILKWNAGRLPAALVHPASAGHGLNLQAGGSTLVWFGLTWSLELYQQTNARLWRQGQKADTVVIQHIVAKDTIDERILKALQVKDDTQSALIEAVKAEYKKGRGNDY